MGSTKRKKFEKSGKNIINDKRRIAQQLTYSSSDSSQENVPIASRKVMLNVY